MNSKSFLFAAVLVILSFFAICFVLEARSALPENEVNDVSVGACVGGYDCIPWNGFCSKPKEPCRTVYRESIFGFQFPDGCDVYEDKGSCPFRFGVKVNSSEPTEAYTIETKDCGELQTYKHQFCDRGNGGFCTPVGIIVEQPCPGSHKSVTGC